MATSIRLHGYNKHHIVFKLGKKKRHIERVRLFYTLLIRYSVFISLNNVLKQFSPPQVRRMCLYNVQCTLSSILNLNKRERDRIDGRQFGKYAEKDKWIHTNTHQI